MILTSMRLANRESACAISQEIYCFLRVDTLKPTGDGGFMAKDIASRNRPLPLFRKIDYLEHMRIVSLEQHPTQAKSPTADPAREIPFAAEPERTDKRSGDGVEPTRYGDWERAGRCIDF